MTTLEKKQIKANLSLIKKLINKVIDYDFKHDTQTFIDYIPHVAWVEFRMPNTPDRKWVFGVTKTSVTIPFDCANEDLEVKIKMVESWLKK